MPRRYSTNETTRALERIGFRFVRQTGSHMRYTAYWRGEQRHVTIVAGMRQIRPKTLGSIIKDAGISAREFAALVDGRTIRE